MKMARVNDDDDDAKSALPQKEQKTVAEDALLFGVQRRALAWDVQALAFEYLTWSDTAALFWSSKALSAQVVRFLRSVKRLVVPICDVKDVPDDDYRLVLNLIAKHCRGLHQIRANFTDKLSPLIGGRETKRCQYWLSVRPTVLLHNASTLRGVDCSVCPSCLCLANELLQSAVDTLPMLSRLLLQERCRRMGPLKCRSGHLLPKKAARQRVVSSITPAKLPSLRDLEIWCNEDDFKIGVGADGACSYADGACSYAETVTILQQGL